MYQIITRSMFIDEFTRAGREDNFSYEGLCALYQYLEDVEGEDDKGVELDVIALCCDWREDTIEEALKDYELESIEELEEKTTVIRLKGDVVLWMEF